MRPRTLNKESPCGGVNPSGSYDIKFTGIKQIIAVLTPEGGINCMTIEYDDNGKSVLSSKYGDDTDLDGLVRVTLSFSFPDEHLTSIEGTYNAVPAGSSNIVLTSLSFITNIKAHQPFGVDMEGTEFSFQVPSGGQIVGLHGSYGRMLNSIGVYWELNSPHRIESVGGVGQHSWDAGINTTVDKIFCVFTEDVMGRLLFSYDNSGQLQTLETESETESEIEERMFAEAIEVASPSEYLVAVSGFIDSNSSPAVIRSIAFVSNYRTYGPFGGKQAGTRFMFPNPPGAGGRILGFFGTYGPHLHSIGAYTEREPLVTVESIGPFGGSSGKQWDDGYYDGIRKIEIFYNDIINSLKIEYAESTDNFVWSELHGSNNDGKKVEISFNYPEEYLVSVDGYYCSRTDNVKSLTFQTNKKKYGPFGPNEGSSFSFSETNTKIIGFHGRTDTCINSIGVHVISISENLMPAQSSDSELTKKLVSLFDRLQLDDRVNDGVKKILTEKETKLLSGNSDTQIVDLIGSLVQYLGLNGAPDVTHD